MQSTDVQSVFASPLQNRDARWQRKNGKKKAMAERGELVSPARRQPPPHLRRPRRLTTSAAHRRPP